MIRAVLLLAPLLALGAQSAPERGPITLSAKGRDFTTRFAIDSLGKVSVSQHGAPGETGFTREETRDAGYPAYDRIAALVKPVRRWAGGVVPCSGEKPIPDGGFWVNPEVTIRWEGEGREVRVPLWCRKGEARDEIELVRAAVEQMRRWLDELHPAEPFDGAANSTYEVLNGEDD